MTHGVRVLGVLMLVAGISLACEPASDAARYTSPNYTIDASIDNSFGGDMTGGSYQLVASGGESIVGNGAGGSYVLDQGYVAQLAQSFELTVEPGSIDFDEEIIAGVSRQSEVEASVRTDAPGYLIAINQTGDLSDGTYTIPGISGGSIASPLTWDEGTTKGLGVSLVSASATAVAAKWSSGAAYAALPNSATTVYSRSGFTGGGTDTLGIRYRIDVSGSQQAGDYTTTAVYTGTMLP